MQIRYPLIIIITINLKEKSNALGPDIIAPSVIISHNCDIDTVKGFHYLGSMMTRNLFLDSEMSKKIDKAATTMVCFEVSVVTEKFRNACGLDY